MPNYCSENRAEIAQLFFNLLNDSNLCFTVASMMHETDYYYEYYDEFV